MCRGPPPAPTSDTDPPTFSEGAPPTAEESVKTCVSCVGLDGGFRCCFFFFVLVLLSSISSLLVLVFSFLPFQFFLFPSASSQLRSRRRSRLQALSTQEQDPSLLLPAHLHLSALSRRSQRPPLRSLCHARDAVCVAFWLVSLSLLFFFFFFFFPPTLSLSCFCAHRHAMQHSAAGGADVPELPAGGGALLLRDLQALLRRPQQANLSLRQVRHLSRGAWPRY